MNTVNKENELMKQNLGNNILRVVGITACILMIPLTLTMFTGEVAWSLFDFIVVGALLMTAGLAYVFIANNMASRRNRILVALAIAAVFAVVYVDLAVGIFDGPFSGS
jgi:hypothetical protein